MKFIHTPKAPAAIGPYSQAILSGNLLFLSGQIPLNPQTMEIVASDIESQTMQVLENIFAVLEASQLTKNQIVKTTIFLKDFNHFMVVNKIYEDFFEGHKPARSTVEVSRLPKDVLIEIECIATL